MLDTGHTWALVVRVVRSPVRMVVEHHPPEFRAEAVALHRSRPGVTIKSVARDLGVNHETLRNWIRLEDAQRAGAPAATASAPARPCRRTRTPRCADDASSTSSPGSGHEAPPVGRKEHLPTGRMRWSSGSGGPRDQEECGVRDSARLIGSCQFE
ncbi:transposase [Saccharothrix lopnurensis]|uniref:Transposase n=1 Tax=Saccharothrix lopnurensis TaxID=1670621 RepID=A0ABW1PB98_9PSEU